MGTVHSQTLHTGDNAAQNTLIAVPINSAHAPHREVRTKHAHTTAAVQLSHHEPHSNPCPHADINHSGRSVGRTRVHSTRVLKTPSDAKYHCQSTTHILRARIDHALALWNPLAPSVIIEAERKFGTDFLRVGVPKVPPPLMLANDEYVEYECTAGPSRLLPELSLRGSVPNRAAGVDGLSEGLSRGSMACSTAAATALRSVILASSSLADERSSSTVTVRPVFSLTTSAAAALNTPSFDLIDEGDTCCCSGDDPAGRDAPVAHGIRPLVFQITRCDVQMTGSEPGIPLRRASTRV